MDTINHYAIKWTIFYCFTIHISIGKLSGCNLINVDCVSLNVKFNYVYDLHYMYYKLEPFNLFDFTYK